MKQRARLLSSMVIAASLPLAACGSSDSSDASGSPDGGGSSPKCVADTSCGGSSPICDLATGACTAHPRGGEIGHGDGTPRSVTFTEIYTMSASAKPVDLAFHPDRKNELWVVGYGDDSTHVGTGVGAGGATWKRYVDPAARHFMHKPPALAMGAANTWATCGNNDNSQNGEANEFTGPALFSADLAIFAKRATSLGSHLDMLHSSPFCRGIAHATANWYWVFNSSSKSIDKYNFGKDHGPGNDDHSDGEIYRYVAGKVRGASDGTPSHLFLDPDDQFLYVADTGNQRIVRLDTTKGTNSDPLPDVKEPLAGSGLMSGTEIEIVVDAGTLEKPSGLELKNGLVYVTDAATSTFWVFDKTGAKVRSLATDLPADSLAGFTFGPDEKIYFTDKVGGRVLRIDVD